MYVHYASQISENCPAGESKLDCPRTGTLAAYPQTECISTVKVGAGGTAPEALIAAGIKPARRPTEMLTFGIDVPDTAPDAPAALIDLVTPNAAMEYWLGYQNFYVITRYNRSSFYAMAVFQFAQTLKERR